MLAITTNDNLYVSDPYALRRPPPTLPPASDLPSGSICSTWSPDGSSLYLAFPSFVNRYDAFGSFMKTVHSQEDIDMPITTLTVKDKGSLIFAAGSLVHILEHSASQTSSSRIVKTLPHHPDYTSVTSLSLSSDGTLLVAASPTTVVTHNLSLNSHTTLRGLKTTDEECISACVVHPHSRVRLFLGIGRNLIIYDITRPTGPAKIISLGETAEGHIVEIACSPYSKTLLAVACSGGSVSLIDLDKEHGKLIKTFKYEGPLTSLTFSLDGATVYTGTANGKLLVQSLRALNESPRSVIVSESGSPVLGLAISKKKPSKDSQPATPSSVVASASAKSSTHPPKPLVQQDTNSPTHTRRREAMSIKSSLGSGTPPKVRSRVSSTVGSTSPNADSRAGAKETAAAAGTLARKKVISSTVVRTVASHSVAKERADSGPQDTSVDIETLKPTTLRTRTDSGNLLKTKLKFSADSKSPPPLPLPPAATTTTKSSKSSSSRGLSSAARVTKTSSSSASPEPIPVANVADIIVATPPAMTAATTDIDKAPQIRTRAISTSTRTTSTTTGQGYRRTRTVSASSPKSPSSLTTGSQPSVRSRTISTTSTAKTSVVSGSSKHSVSNDATITMHDNVKLPAKTRTTSGSSSGSGTTTSTGGTRSRTASVSKVSRPGSVTVARSGSPIPPVPPLPAPPKNEVHAKYATARKISGGNAKLKVGGDGQGRTPSPELPMPSPVKEDADDANRQADKGKVKAKVGVLGLGTPEVERWIRAGQGQREGNGKKVGFASHRSDASDSEEFYQGLGASRVEDVSIDGEEDADVQRRLAEHEQRLEEKSMTMQITPHRLGSGRGTGAGTISSPFTHLAAASPHDIALPSSSTTNSGLNAVGNGGGGAQGLLHALIQDAMVDIRQESKAEMVGLHLDLLRMGRAWRMEMRSAIDGFGGELKELREENKRLKEENERLRRGY